MLRKIRLTLAVVCFVLTTGLFLDFTGTHHPLFGWLARVQFVPAVLALNVGVIVSLVVLTLLFGRVYCSVVCPLGAFQDVVSWLSARRKGKRRRFRYTPPQRVLRCVVLIVFVAAAAAGVGSLVALIEPYSAYGRMVHSLAAPLYTFCNNLLAGVAERADSYLFYERDVWLRSVPTLVVAAVTLAAIVTLAWRGGRTYCNSVCPVGTILGALARFALFRPTIDAGKCVGCGLCERRCKASCIAARKGTIDLSRCVGCMDCIDECRHGALAFAPRRGGGRPVTTGGQPPQGSRRAFLLGMGLLLGGVAVKAEEKKVDGGLAVILDKKVPSRQTPIVPPGALSITHMARHCTGCQLCVTVCPNDVLRPSHGLLTLMQPHVSYERGYCRPECVKCSEVCPTGAIIKITREEKSSTQIGHAVWIAKNCLPLADGTPCGNCARHCPTGAIIMVESTPGDRMSPRVPVVNNERCIGCGACESLCPARPFSAIYVEGHEMHRTI